MITDAPSVLEKLVEVMGKQIDRRYNEGVNRAGGGAGEGSQHVKMST